MAFRFARRSSSDATALLVRVFSWPARVYTARRTMRQLSALSDYELRDIGLTRQDLADSTALPLDADPSTLLVRRRAGRAVAKPRVSEAA